jgi:serine/threonine-protein kinase HipA
MRFSLPGVQMKFSVRRDRDGYVVPEDGTGGTHILKLPDAHNPQLPENEAAMMQFAAACGIEVPPFELVDMRRIAGLPQRFQRLTGNAYAIEHFDRTADGSVHMEDFAQVLSVYPENKYARRSFDTLMAVCNSYIGADALAEFVRRLVFTIAIANADAI